MDRLKNNFLISEKRFYSMSTSQRKNAIKKFNEYHLNLAENPPLKVQKGRQLQENYEDLAAIDIQNIPQSISKDICQESIDILSESSSNIIKGHGSSYFVVNKNSINQPFHVIVKGNGDNITCQSDLCFRFKTFGICAHVLCVAKLENKVKSLLARCNKKKPKISQLSDRGKDKGAGQKKTKSTQRRKGVPNKPRVPLARIVPKAAPIVSGTPSTPPVNPDVPSNGNSPIVSGTTPPPPTNPDVPSNGYSLFLFQFCHKNVSKCYGCGSSFDAPMDDPNNLIIVSKTNRSYIDPTTKIKMYSSDLSRVYYHFNFSCLQRQNQMFSINLIKVPEDLKPHLSATHKTVLRSTGIEI